MIVHGGAWQIPDAQKGPHLEGVKKAATIAYRLLCRHGTAVDAVEAAVRHLESDPTFDAGTGSCLTSAGTVEMDAAIMTDTPALGAVAAVSDIEHPITAARAVLNIEHSMLVGQGAHTFIKEMNMPLIESSRLVSDAARREWERFNNYDKVVKDLFNSGHDTVGAVAIDSAGRLACATSTGGITYKRLGRVGDSPIAGSGLYCLPGVAAVSATGHGESILKSVLCKHLVDLMSMRGDDLVNASVGALSFMKDLTGGCGGVVALDSRGNWSAEFTTNRMAWACIDRERRLHAGVDRGEVIRYDVADQGVSDDDLDITNAHSNT